MIRYLLAVLNIFPSMIDLYTNKDSDKIIEFPTDKQFLMIIDFEATCSNDKTIKRQEMEIIEFAAVLVDKLTLEIVKEFSEFIKPKIHPKLSEFCTKLTTITQNDVDSAKTFPIILTNFIDKMYREDSVFVSWGDYDKNQLLQDCKYHKVSYPFTEEHINVKKLTAKYLQLPRPKGIGGMLRYLDLEFVGTPHRGIDDIRNIIRILRKINSYNEQTS